MRIAVLAYHSQNITGRDYASNDHIAFERDLALISSLALPLISLKSVVRCLRSGTYHNIPARAVVLTCDDGTIQDWMDYQHPDHGYQESLAKLLRRQTHKHHYDEAGLLTSFVIASKEARAAIDTGCYTGIPLSQEEWWRDATDDGLVAIENHSWDHLHPVIPWLNGTYGEAGSFYSVDNYLKADKQVRVASEYIEQVLTGLNHQCSLFAYPFGHISDYLLNSYFPNFFSEHRIEAAVTTESDYLTEDTNVYAIPRFVCGNAWSQPDGLRVILEKL
jgi:hypothetical protein